jgi:hypothetical protein
MASLNFLKTTRRILLTTLLLLGVSGGANAQGGYKTGIGFRLSGITSGLSVKHFTGGSGALEGILGFRYRSWILTGLYEKHQAFPNAEGLSWFYGGGAHVGFYDDGYRYYYYKVRGNKYVIVDEDRNDRMALGVDFILGLEYKFKNAPITIGLDAKPFIDIVPDVSGYWDAALSFRFTL